MINPPDDERDPLDDGGDDRDVFECFLCTALSFDAVCADCAAMQ